MENVFIHITMDVYNLNIGDMTKEKPSLCNVFDIMREMMCKPLKKILPNETFV